MGTVSACRLQSRIKRTLVGDGLFQLFQSLSSFVAVLPAEGRGGERNVPRAKNVVTSQERKCAKVGYLLLM